MLKIRIIPCLDVKNGRIVKGVNFKNLKDAGDPVLTAQVYDELGADEICFLDIAATLENRDVTLDLVRKTSEKCFIPITVGGGIRTIEDIRHLLLNGADKVSFNSAAIRDPDIISTAANKFGSQCIVAISFAKDMQERGAGEILLTSMDKDGTKDGYDIELTKLISDSLNIPVIASGGAGKLEHFKSVLEKGKASAILAASIFHFGEISIKQVKSYLRSEGIPVRM